MRRLLLLRRLGALVHPVAPYQIHLGSTIMKKYITLNIVFLWIALIVLCASINPESYWWHPQSPDWVTSGTISFPPDPCAGEPGYSTTTLPRKYLYEADYSSTTAACYRISVQRIK